MGSEELCEIRRSVYLSWLMQNPAESPFCKKDHLLLNDRLREHIKKNVMKVLGNEPVRILPLLMFAI